MSAPETPVGSDPSDPSGPTSRRQRRRFARRQWRRRWLTWKYLLGLVVVLGLAVAGVWLIFFSSVLAVQKVEVRGSHLLTADRVREVADIELGRPLALVDLDRAQRRLSTLDEVRSVDVTRDWPHGVRIQLTERQVVAVVRFGSLLRGMDEEGVVFRDYRRMPRGLPLLQAPTGTDTAALAEGAKVIASLPQDVAGQVEHVQVDSVDKIVLVLRDDRQVLWGSADESAAKAEVLATLLSQPARVYDVSAPSLPTIRQ